MGYPLYLPDDRREVSGSLNLCLTPKHNAVLLQAKYIKEWDFEYIKIEDRITFIPHDTHYMGNVEWYIYGLSFKMKANLPRKVSKFEIDAAEALSRPYPICKFTPNNNVRQRKKR